MYKCFLSLFISIQCFYTNAQYQELIINSNISLPSDSIFASKLTNAIQFFLFEAKKENTSNKSIVQDQKLETFLLLDELRGIQNSRKYKDSSFYKPYLANIVMLDSSKYLIQISYIGKIEDTVLHRATLSFYAHKSKDDILFSSVFNDKTKYWKNLKVDNNYFYYKNDINKKKIVSFKKWAKFYDNKLGIKNKIVKFYCTDNIVELQSLNGIEYMSDNNGRRNGIFSTTLDNTKIVILGNKAEQFDDFDIHDLFHDRLSLVIPRSKVYKPVDEACAYLYGGSWGISWKDILTTFKEKVAVNKDINWMDTKENPVNFGESKEKHLMIDYVVNALIVKKLEAEKGFGAVWELLNCGKWEKDNKSYYKTLEKLTGITKQNYNDKIWELIKSEK